jgi:hypothetical protein
MTKTISDDRLYSILRDADPLAEESKRSSEATETALARLIATTPPSATVPRPALRRQLTRWWAVRLTPIMAAAAAAVALLAALPSGGPIAVPAASAKLILAKAAAAVMGTDGAILHVDISATQTWQQGGSEQWTEQAWQQVSPPYNDRSIDTGIWPTAVEMADVRGSEWLYDASTNTVYTNEPAPAFTLTPGSQSGTYTLRTGDGTSGPSLTVSASQAAALRAGTDIWASDGNGGLLVVPRPTTGSQILSDFRPEILALLHSPTATVTQDATIDGQNAVKITSADGATTYYANPSTYAPIQMTQPVPNTGVPGNSATTTLTFTDWQNLTGAAADPGLLSLAAQHPTATVDSNAADWTAAASRLFH